MPKRLATVCATLIAIGFTIATLFDGSMIFAAGGCWALAIALIPRAPLFSIWSFVVLTIAIGLSARGFFVSFNYPDPDTIDRLFLLGSGPDFFVKPLVILLVGIGAMTAGFELPAFKKTPIPETKWDSRKVSILGFSVLGIAFISALLYAHFTGGLRPDAISAKRTPIPDLELAGMGFQSFGALRHLASLAIFAHVLVLAHAFRSGRKRDFLLAWALLFGACLQPFYASVRTAVAANLIFSAAVVYFLGGGKSRVKLAIFGIVIVVIVSAMTTLRPGNDEDWNAAESVVLNRNQIELAKTAHIIHSIPETLDFQYGKTFAKWLAAPIPREIWSNKPVIHPGPEIGNRVYGQRVAGVPPGIVAEMWWNFWWFGVVIGCFAFGVFLQWMETRLSPSDSMERVVIFVSGPMLLGYESVGSSLGSGIFRTVLGLVVILVMVKFVRKREAF